MGNWNDIRNGRYKNRLEYPINTKIIGIDETPANSFIAFYGYDKSY